MLNVISPAEHSGTAIREAGLLVRAADWWPVEENLTIQAGRELRHYRLVLAEYQVVSRRAAAAIFPPSTSVSKLAAPAPAPEPKKETTSTKKKGKKRS